MIYKTENHNLDDIQSLLTAFVAESVYDRPVNVEGLKRTVESPATMTVVVYDGETPVAIFVGYTYNHPMFHAKFAADLLLYVTPEHRGSPIAFRLAKMFMAWAEKNKVDYTTIGQSTGIGNMNRVREFYEKLGFKLTGFNCLKEQ
jgi:GNAT superfamily N-acetyltransferase